MHLGERAEEQVDDDVPAARPLRVDQRQRAVDHRQVVGRRDHVDVIALDLHPPGDLRHRHAGRHLQDRRGIALVRRREVQDDDERHVRLGGQAFEQGLDRGRARRRRRRCRPPGNRGRWIPSGRDSGAEAASTGLRILPLSMRRDPGGARRLPSTEIADAPMTASSSDSGKTRPPPRRGGVVGTIGSHESAGHPESETQASQRDANERADPPRRRDDVLEPDRRRRPPLPADQARLAGAPQPAGGTRSRCRAATPRAGAAPPAVAAPARQRRLSPAAAPRRDRARAARPRARPDRGRRPVPRRLGRARRGARARHPGGRRPATRTSRRWRGSPPGAASARVAARRRGAMRATSIAASTSCSRRAAACATTCVDWGVERVACQPLGVDTAAFHPERARRRAGAARSASPPMPACSSTPAASRPRSISTCSPTRSARLGAPLRAARRSAPGRRRRRRAGARRLPFVADVDDAGDDARRAPTPSSTPATRRPSACRCSRRWPAARRSSCAAPKAWPSSPTAPAASRSSAARARRSPKRSLRCFAGDRRRSVARARARAEANDWEQVLPGLLGHYRRLLDGRPARRRLRRRRDGARSLVPAAGTMSDETTITPSRFESERFVCVVLHDVAPSTRAACVRTLAAVAEVAGDVPVTLLAVPRYHDEAADARPRSTGSAARRAAATSWRCTAAASRRRHRRRTARSTACAAASTPAARASSGPRREREATARIEVGIDWFARNGWPLAGFVAPAWLLGPGAWRGAGRRSRFEYTATLRELVHLPGRRPRHEPERRLQHVERLAAAELARLERGRRHGGARQPGAAPRAASARRRFRRRAALVAEDARAGAATTGGR